MLDGYTVSIVVHRKTKLIKIALAVILLNVCRNELQRKTVVFQQYYRFRKII